MFYKSKIIIFEFKRTEDKLSRLRDLVNIGYKILVVNWLFKFIALAKLVTGGQEIAPKIHQHFIPGLVKPHFKKT